MLLARVAVVVALAFLFARPFLQDCEKVAPSDLEAVILVEVLGSKNFLLHCPGVFGLTIPMKTCRWGLVIIVLLGIQLDALGDPNKVGITAMKKHADGAQVHAATGKGSDKEVFELSLTNQTFGDLSQLKIDYIIFIERPKLGKPLSEPPAVDRITGSKTLDVLTNRQPKIVTTDEFTLGRNTIRAGYYYDNGGRMKTVDNVVGVWVKVSQNGEVIGEYTNPPTVTKRTWELKQSGTN